MPHIDILLSSRASRVPLSRYFDDCAQQDDVVKHIDQPILVLMVAALVLTRQRWSITRTKIGQRGDTSP